MNRSERRSEHVNRRERSESMWTGEREGARMRPGVSKSENG